MNAFKILSFQMRSLTMNRAAFLPLLSVLASVSSAGCGGTEPAPIEIGDLAPSFSLPVAGGTGVVSQQSLQGKITILNFWSMSCSVCLKETEDLGRVHEAGKAVVVGIALDEDGDQLCRFVKAMGIKYPVVRGNEDVFSRYDGSAIPYTLILDRNRAVRKRVIGRFSSEEIEREIQKLDGSSITLVSPAPIGTSGASN
jgi:thiol-disulfide isomerase/thioredoxin